jgi:predicted RND superfamily exporter protein
MKSALAKATRWILRFSGWITAFGLLLSVVGGYYTVHLYQNLRTDLEELLPLTARSVVDMNEVTSRLKSVDNLAILVFSKDKKESKRFVVDLASKLAKAPKEAQIASVEYRIDRELQFFKSRKALYIDLPDLVRIRDYVGERIDYEKKLYNPLNIFSEVELPEPRFDFEALLRKYESRSSAYTRFPDGFYANADESIRVMLVNMEGKASGVAGLQRLSAFVQKSITELEPAKNYGNPEIKFAGGVQNTLEEQAALIGDLGISSVVVMVLVGLAMFIFFKAFRATSALLLSLFCGIFWTFGLTFQTVGYLNANSAFLGSIIIGNGINFGTIFLARYLEERRRKVGHARSLYRAMQGTGPATVTAALAAGLSYGSLMATSFRGFNQFGKIGLMGMILCWISAFTLLPAFLTVLESFRPLVPAHRAKPAKSYFSDKVARGVRRFPRLIWSLSFIVTVVSLALFTRYSPDILESDLAKLRSKSSMEHGSGYYSLFIDQIFGRYLSPMVVMPREREDALRIAERLKQTQKQEGDRTLLASVQTIDDFLPKDQTRKIEVIREIRNLLPPKLVRQLSPEDRRKVADFLDPTALIPLRMEDLPLLIRDKFTEKNGSIGKLVVVEPPITKEVLNRVNLQRFVKTLRDAADTVAPGSPVAGPLPISGDLIESISRDGPLATLYAFLAVVILIAVLFRNFRTVALCLMSLTLGVVWLAGIVLGLGIKINFLNFIALPITFGIGVDYGVNIFQRYREEGAGSILRVVRETGGAVSLCSFTTIVGYGSLLLAENQAFVSFGLIAVIGEVTCLLAAIFSLPALLLVLSHKEGAPSENPSPTTVA